MGGGEVEDGTEKICGPIAIISLYMNPIIPKVWKKLGALIRCPKTLRTTLHVEGRTALILVCRNSII